MGLNALVIQVDSNESQTVSKFDNSIVELIAAASLVPRPHPAFQRFMRKAGGPDARRHVSDVSPGTDLELT